MSNSLHVLGLPHTVPHEDYLVCAFTAKVMLFPEVIQPFGWDVIEYSNEGSVSKAREHVRILTKDQLQALSRRTSRDEPLDIDVNNTELRDEFQRVLLEKIRSRAQPGDIVCHIAGPNMEVYNLLPNCKHIELCVGYTASPGLPFRIYESSAWMHWHYGKAGQEDGNNYRFVVPSPIDVDIWNFCEEPDDYAVFLGRVTPRKGINTLIEIARRMPELPVHVYGPGDTSGWEKDAPPNLQFKGPVFGNKRVDVVRRARCMLMPTVFIEPFGNSGVEAQLCGVPLIAVSFGAFQETLLEGVTGYRCHTLADWVEAIRLSRSLDRRQISTLARSKYSKEAAGKQYDWVLKQLSDLSGRGWYADKSRKFAKAAALTQPDNPRKPRIWLYIPFFGAFPNYFQLYLDSLGKNADCLSVFLMTDTDLSGYRLPDNLIPIRLTLGALREKAARFINDAFGMNVQPDALLKQPYKLCDFRIIYPELFLDVSEQYGVTENDFVGWGDCDLIYGRFSDFLDTREDYQVIGGFHGHLTAFRNSVPFRELYKAVEDLPRLLLDETSHIADERAIRKPLDELIEKNGYRMFYINRYFCDIVPQCFFGLFRQDHSQRKKNFFDGYHPNQEIDYLRYDPDGTLTVVYEDGDSRQSIYCHLQKRAMSMDVGSYENGYYIREHAFRLDLTAEIAESGVVALPGAAAPLVAKSRRQKVCLAMIVKNEARVIARCLKSVRPLIDYWVIVDTGSTDGTQDIVRKGLHDVPGELHERPWVDFAHNRSEALTLARPNGDYTFVIDADDVLELPPGYERPRLRADSYEVEFRHLELRYWRTQLFRNSLPWRYEGVLHEFPSYEGPDKRRVLSEEHSHLRLSDACIRMTDEGARRQVAESERYRRDAKLLERALATETDPFLRSRYQYYYAQSCLHAGEKEKALAAYLERAKLGYWDQEVFISLYKAAQIKVELDLDGEDVIATFLKAHKVCEDRAEALHGAARFCRATQRYQQGYELAKRAMKIKHPDHGLALEDWIYDFGALDEYAVTAFWTGRYVECADACDRLLSEGKLPAEERERILKNKQLAMDKLQLTAAGPPAAGDAGHQPKKKDDAGASQSDRPAPAVEAEMQNVAPSATGMPQGGEAKPSHSGRFDAQARVQDLARTLRELLQDRPVVLLDWPSHNNSGDHFIWLGEKILLKQLAGLKVVAEFGSDPINPQQLYDLPSNSTLVFHGGGNFGDIYERHQRLREAVVAAFPNRRIVLMPQSVHYRSEERLQRAAALLRQHPDLHVMARDRHSLRVLEEQMRLRHCYLHIDSAFALQKIVDELVAIIPAAARTKTLRLVRRDRESIGALCDPAGGASFDWAGNAESPDFASTDAQAISSAREAVTSDFDLYSWNRLCKAVRLFAGADRIITDRLHGHILAMLMRRPHELHDNNYGKNLAFHQTWTSASQLVTCVSAQRSAEVAASGPEEPVQKARIEDPEAQGDVRRTNCTERRNDSLHSVVRPNSPTSNLQPMPRQSKRSGVAIITPYYQESRDVLERCIKSVQDQTEPADHFLIADGYPQDWIDGAHVRHIRLDCSHADYGDTPRGIGAMVAASEGYQAIGFLDADCWLEPDHVEYCLGLARQAEPGYCDYVVALRHERRPDGSIMKIGQVSHEKHVDTNCYFFLKSGFRVLPVWSAIPREVSSVGDRLFYKAVKANSLRRVVASRKTVNYTCSWASIYRAMGEEPPPGAKPNPDHCKVEQWISALSPEDRATIDSSIQTTIEDLYPLYKVEIAQSGGEPDEGFVTLHSAAERLRAESRPFDEVIAAYDRASDAAPHRAEALHGASRHCRENKKFAKGYEYARRGLAIQPPVDCPSDQRWIYEYGLLDELAVNAYWIGKYAECADACDRLLSEGKLPAEKRERVLKNKQFAIDKLAQMRA